jgi:hypothetical protein
MHVPPLQTVFAALQVPEPPLAVGQQPRPRSPHLVQTPPLLQVVPGAVHEPAAELPPQQGSPAPPQVPQTPALHTPPPAPTQVPPGIIQIPETQQPPPLQVLPAQQEKPGSPQVTPPLSTPPPVAPPTPTSTRFPPEPPVAAVLLKVEPP